MCWWSQPPQFGQYQACLCSDDVYGHSLVNTEPVYVMTMSTTTVWSIPSLFMLWRCLLTEFGRYYACLCSEDVNWQSLVNNLPFMFWRCQLTEFGHACLWSDNINWLSLVNNLPVYVLTMSTDRVWSITCLVMFWRCLLTEFGQCRACLVSDDVKWHGNIIPVHMLWPWPQVGNIGLIMVHWQNNGHIIHQDFVPILGK